MTHKMCHIDGCGLDSQSSLYAQAMFSTGSTSKIFQRCVTAVLVTGKGPTTGLHGEKKRKKRKITNPTANQNSSPPYSLLNPYHCYLTFSRKHEQNWFYLLNQGYARPLGLVLIS